MVKHKNKQIMGQKETTFAYFGVGIVILGCIASIYYAYTSRSFINEALDLGYYLNYLILLGGGFVIGYLLTKGGLRLFGGAVYALLTMSVYWMMDIVRSVATDLLHLQTGPWFREKLFMTMPLIILAAVAVFAFIVQRKNKKSSIPSVTRHALIGTLVITHLYILLDTLLYLVNNPSASNYIAPVWLMIGSYLVNPLFVMFVTYLIFNDVPNKLLRLFYAAFVASFCFFLYLVLWHFRTDPTLDSTIVFETIVISVAVLITGLLLWRVRRI